MKPPTPPPISFIAVAVTVTVATVLLASASAATTHPRSTGTEANEVPAPSNNHSYELRCSPRVQLLVDGAAAGATANFRSALLLLCMLARAASTEHHPAVVAPEPGHPGPGFRFGFLQSTEAFVTEEYYLNSTEKKKFDLLYSDDGSTNATDIYVTFSYTCRYGPPGHAFVVGERPLRQGSVAWVLLSRLACRDWWEGRAAPDSREASAADDYSATSDEAVSAFTRRLRAARDAAALQRARQIRAMLQAMRPAQQAHQDLASSSEQPHLRKRRRDRRSQNNRPIRHARPSEHLHSMQPRRLARPDRPSGPFRHSRSDKSAGAMNRNFLELSNPSERFDNSGTLVRQPRDLRDNRVDELPPPPPQPPPPPPALPAGVDALVISNHSYSVRCAPQEETLFADGEELRITRFMQSAVRCLCSMLPDAPDSGDTHSLGYLVAAEPHPIEDYLVNSLTDKRLEVAFTSRGRTGPSGDAGRGLAFPLWAHCGSWPPALVAAGRVLALRSLAWAMLTEARCGRGASRLPPPPPPSPPHRTDDAKVWRTLQMHPPTQRATTTADGGGEDTDVVTIDETTELQEAATEALAEVTTVLSTEVATERVTESARGTEESPWPFGRRHDERSHEDDFNGGPGGRLETVETAEGMEGLGSYENDDGGAIEGDRGFTASPLVGFDDAENQEPLETESDESEVFEENEDYVEEDFDPRNHSYSLTCMDGVQLAVDGVSVRVSSHFDAALFFLCALLSTAKPLPQYDFGYITTVEPFRTEDVAVDSPGNGSLEVLYETGVQPQNHEVNIFWQICRSPPSEPEFSLDSGALLPHSIVWSLFNKVRCGDPNPNDDSYRGLVGPAGAENLEYEDHSLQEIPTGLSDRHNYVMRCTPGIEALIVDGRQMMLTPHMESALGLLCYSAGLHGGDGGPRKYEALYRSA